MVLFQDSTITTHLSEFYKYVENKAMYWLHCNGCYCQPEPGVELRFFITNCSHIYCEKCVNSCTKERCKVCQSQCTTLELNGKLQKEVEDLFDEPAAAVQKAMKKVCQTIEFQKSHQRRWCRHLKETLRRQSEQMKDVRKLVASYRALEKESIEMKKENNYLKCLLAKNSPGPRSGPRSVAYPSSSPNQSIFGKSPSHGTSGGMSSRTSKSGSSVLNQPGRILMRTPPSENGLGTTRSRLSYMTPGSAGSSGHTNTTPLTVPRPIYLGNTDSV